MSSPPPLTVMPWQDFIMNPHTMFNLFKNTPGQMDYDEDKVIVSKQALDNPLSGVFQVETPDELERLLKKITTCPIFVKIKLSFSQTHTHRSGSVQVQQIARTSGEYALLLNTAHPEIKEQLDSQMKECVGLMKSGKNFCLEFNCGDLLNNWYADRLGAISGFNSNYQTLCLFTRFYITNTTIYKHCFDCNLVWCMFCCICWCFSAPCYKAARACTTTDFYVNLKAEVNFREHVVLAPSMVVDSIQRP